MTDLVGLEGVLHVSHWTMQECVQQARFPVDVMMSETGGEEDTYSFAACLASPPEPPAERVVLTSSPDALRPLSYIGSDSERFHRLLASVRRGARARRERADGG